MTMLTRHDRRAGESVLQTDPLDRLLGLRVRVPWDVAAVAALCALAVAFRFYALGDRAIHHDESLHATFAWYFYKGMGYTHDPLMHGPLLFHLMSFFYMLFGVNDATTRFVPALLGSLLVLLPWLLRPFLGRVGAAGAALLLAI